MRLLSYNLFLRPIVKNVRDDWKEERMRAYLAFLDRFDIICNQEVFDWLNRGRKERLIAYTQKAGLVYYAMSPKPSFFSEYWIDGGLVTFSRFPIVEAGFRPYHCGVLAD